MDQDGSDSTPVHPEPEDVFIPDLIRYDLVEKSGIPEDIVRTEISGKRIFVANNVNEVEKVQKMLFESSPDPVHKNGLSFSWAQLEKWNKEQIFPIILFAYKNFYGQYRLLRIRKNPKITFYDAKYLSPKGSTNYIYIPELIIQKIENERLENIHTVLVTEGEKKAIALSRLCLPEQGVITIGLIGWYGYCLKGGAILEDFITLVKGRRVVLVPDAPDLFNQKTKGNPLGTGVPKALKDLIKQLVKNINVEFDQIFVANFSKECNGNEKVGADDFLKIYPNLAFDEFLKNYCISAEDYLDALEKEKEDKPPKPDSTLLLADGIEKSNRLSFIQNKNGAWYIDIKNSEGKILETIRVNSDEAVKAIVGLADDLKIPPINEEKVLTILEERAKATQRGERKSNLYDGQVKIHTQRYYAIYENYAPIAFVVAENPQRGTFLIVEVDKETQPYKRLTYHELIHRFPSHRWVLPKDTTPLPKIESPKPEELKEEGPLLQLYKKIFKVGTDKAYIFIAFHFQTFLGEVPRYILYLIGPQGSGKSTAAKQLKAALTGDDSVINTLGKGKEDLPLLFSQQDIVIWDNAEQKSVDTQTHQLLCSSSTGGGHFQRQLYTDEVIRKFVLHTNLIITSVHQPSQITRNSAAADLERRLLVVKFPGREDEHNTSPKFLIEDAKNLRPHLLGWWLMALGYIMKRWQDLPPEERIKSTSPGVCFVEIHQAIRLLEEGGLLGKPGTFDKIYKKNAQETFEQYIEEDQLLTLFANVFIDEQKDGKLGPIKDTELSEKMKNKAEEFGWSEKKKEEINFYSIRSIRNKLEKNPKIGIRIVKNSKDKKGNPLRIYESTNSGWITSLLNEKNGDEPQITPESSPMNGHPKEDLSIQELFQPEESQITSESSNGQPDFTQEFSSQITPEQTNGKLLSTSQNPSNAKETEIPHLDNIENGIVKDNVKRMMKGIKQRTLHIRDIEIEFAAKLPPEIQDQILLTYMENNLSPEQYEEKAKYFHNVILNDCKVFKVKQERRWTYLVTRVNALLKEKYS